jgi:hypothetical protein
MSYCFGAGWGSAGGVEPGGSVVPPLGEPAVGALPPEVPVWTGAGSWAVVEPAESAGSA